MSLPEKLRELRANLTHSIEIIDSVFAFLHFSPPPTPPSDQSGSSGESDYNSSDESERFQNLSPPLLVHQNAVGTLEWFPGSEGSPIAIDSSSSDEEEEKQPQPRSRINPDGSITYIRQRPIM
jgi:hypothetical protein